MAHLARGTMTPKSGPRSINQAIHTRAWALQVQTRVLYSESFWERVEVPMNKSDVMEERVASNTPRWHSRRGGLSGSWKLLLTAYNAMINSQSLEIMEYEWKKRLWLGCRQNNFNSGCSELRTKRRMREEGLVDGPYTLDANQKFRRRREDCREPRQANTWRQYPPTLYYTIPERLFREK